VDLQRGWGGGTRTVVALEHEEEANQATRHRDFDDGAVPRKRELPGEHEHVKVGRMVPPPHLVALLGRTDLAQLEQLGSREQVSLLHHANVPACASLAARRFATGREPCPGWAAPTAHGASGAARRT